ncbi:hypothetical protein [Brevibacillus sp. NRS-1366]|uniref:hypothetical protein n=1 Tax=Brevibacillus sp. NRS-1366 TaxID=3233899 RepID=UPI003D2537B5
MQGTIDEKIHLPDLSFCKNCENAYGINRGVYNTIDSFFYSKGITDILERRRMIVDFLEFTITCKTPKDSPIKFGHGGLTQRINEFLPIIT